MIHKYWHIADAVAGYPSSAYVIRPFNEWEITAASATDKTRMRAFNKCVSHIWIVSEHAFGLFKARFPSLREMGPHKKIQDMYKAIKAMMIIHNICIDWVNKPEDIWDINNTDSWSDDEEEGDDDTDGNGIIEGEAEVQLHETENCLLHNFN